MRHVNDEFVQFDVPHKSFDVRLTHVVMTFAFFTRTKQINCHNHAHDARLQTFWSVRSMQVAAAAAAAADAMSVAARRDADESGSFYAQLNAAMMNVRVGQPLLSLYI
jgi:hypothetical protein